MRSDLKHKQRTSMSLRIYLWPDISVWKYFWSCGGRAFAFRGSTVPNCFRSCWRLRAFHALQPELLLLSQDPSPVLALSSCVRCPRSLEPCYIQHCREASAGRTGNEKRGRYRRETWAMSLLLTRGQGSEARPGRLSFPLAVAACLGFAHPLE